MRIQHALTLAVLSLLVMAPAANAQTSPPLDYVRRIQQNEMVFVPYIGMTRGPIYYTKYEQVSTGVSGASGFRRVILNLTPTAHRLNQYNSFISQNGITDIKTNPVPAVGSCQPSEEIKALTAYMPEGFKPKVLAGNYPTLCSLSVYFLPEEEVATMAFINTHAVIVLRATVPLCDPASARLNLGPINQRLVQAGVLSTNAASELVGNSWDVLFESAKLAQTAPYLFVTSDPQVGWEIYMKSFTLDLTAQTATMTALTAGQQAYICTPAPLSLTFG
ncbi:hypothetical protein OV208_25360 [Corallococcus sp. bb12-1]|uniref:hypothetical protein n=1 Tax=Corallococcus sp. bb12-1 TaxID=2996784 RepID=UPI002271A7B4|nr:hypothetical protein [Corallococcus sp. bb12-1]MCY1044671.1 hypothetical protein [Corallococcus sp. bb12-1]